MDIPFCAMKALIQKDNTYLVLLSSYGEKKIAYYDLPGGRIFWNENPYDALHREIFEELQSEIEIKDSLWIWWFDRIDGKRVVCHTFLCTLKNNILDITKNPSQDEDIREFLWMTKKELLDATLFQNTSIYDIFRKLPA